MSAVLKTGRFLVGVVILGTLGVALWNVGCGIASQQASAPSWPPITRESKPWTRWWWMGSAVDEKGLTAELQALNAVGIGGVEITPIYGAARAEARFVPFLSDRWVQLLEHTIGEASRLDLGVDMATGTGWPFGGPWVGERDACRTLVFQRWTVHGGSRLTERVRLEQTPMVRAIGNQIYEVLETTAGEPSAQGTRQQPLLRPGARATQISDLLEPVEANQNQQALALEQVRYPKPLPLVALVAHSTSDAIVDLTTRVAKDGTLDWVAPDGMWTLYGVFLGWHGKLVERAAPGGEGNVIDHFSQPAIRRYLERFDPAFKGRRLDGLRAFFNDSYEVDDASGQASGTPALFEEFAKRRGYDVRRHLPALAMAETSDRSTRVRADYRLTISDLLLETFTAEWSAWARKRGARVRNQAHGSPGSLLDLYAASDIPETEGNELPRFKWASSAAHVAGRQLVSAEAATWLGEHFRSTLAEVRAAVDRFFVAGVNHIVYHGTAYSPANEPWPGWLFYASVEFNSRNPWWQDFAALNQYVTRVQSFLQAGRPDQDVLLYYPFYDSLAGLEAPLLKHFGGANPPPEKSAFEEAAAALQRRGFTYDYISDRQLGSTRQTDGGLTTSGGGRYLTVVMPTSRFLPLETFEHVLALARSGATVVAFKDLPQDVAGLGDLDRRRARFHELRSSLRFGAADGDGVSEARVGKGAILRGQDLERLLVRAGVSRESLVDQGLEFTRRRYAGGRYYFIANSSAQRVSGWIPLADRSAHAVLFDPMTGKRGDARLNRTPAGTLQVQLRLMPGESVIVASASVATGERDPFPGVSGPPLNVAGPWTVTFVAGGPVLPDRRTIDTLSAWTTFGGDEFKHFSGTAVYTTTFARPAGNAPRWLLDLGAVKESARVRLNGRDLGTLIGPTFRMTLDASHLSDRNTVEVHVTNLMANRIAALDKAGVPWRKFYNVNFPARLPQNRGTDGLFTAAKWEPLESGLIGPVSLAPVK
jgi:hypothetical protein